MSNETKKNITIKDIARECNVGVGTVSRVINGSGYVSTEVRKKIENLISDLNFIPNRSAVNLKKQKQGLIALLVPMSMDPFFSKFAYYTEDALYRKGYKMILVNSQGAKEKEINVFNMLPSMQVDGIIVVTHHMHDYEFDDFPIVTIDRHLTEKTPYVTSDNYHATFKALEFLYAKGCRKIGAILGKTTVLSETNYRYTAYRDFIKQKGLDIYEFWDLYYHGEENRVVREFFKKYPEIDGLFTSSDTLAANAYNVASSLGRIIPDDLQIIAYDGILDQYLDKKITAVVQKVENMALKAVDTIVKRINKEPYDIINIIPALIVEGDTTK